MAAGRCVPALAFIAVDDRGLQQLAVIAVRQADGDPHGRRGGEQRRPRFLFVGVIGPQAAIVIESLDAPAQLQGCCATPSVCISMND